MIVGVEGQHTPSTSSIVLGDPSPWPSAPWYKLRRVELHHLADLEAVDDKLIGRPGTIPRHADRGGKAVVYEGDVMARSMEQLSAARAALIAAFAGTDELRMDATGHVDRYFYARPLELDPPDEQLAGSSRVTRGFERPFSLTLRMSDPRFYDPDTVEEEDTSTVAIGGNPVPFTPGGYVEPGTAEAFEVTIDNTGNADTDGQLELHGPWRNPVLSNRTLDDAPFLRFADLVLADDEEVVIDFRRRTAKRTNGTSVRHKLDPASTWWDRGVPCFAPGPNLIRGRGFNLNTSAGAKLIARCDPGDWA